MAILVNQIPALRQDEVTEARPYIYFHVPENRDEIVIQLLMLFTSGWRPVAMWFLSRTTNMEITTVPGWSQLGAASR
jgi:hypothetical protein